MFIRKTMSREIEILKQFAGRNTDGPFIVISSENAAKTNKSLKEQVRFWYKDTKTQKSIWNTTKLARNTST